MNTTNNNIDLEEFADLIKIARRNHPSITESEYEAMIAQANPDRDYLCIELPDEGSGHNAGLMRAANLILNEFQRTDEEAEDHLASIYHRDVADVRRAIQRVRGGGTSGNSPKFPDADERLIAAAVSQNRKTVANLKERSPGSLDTPAFDVIRVLMRESDTEDPLVCIGSAKNKFTTKPLSAFKDHAHKRPFIVPQPMTKLKGETKEGHLSAKSDDNTSERSNLVVEFDEIPDKDEQAALLLSLAEFAPLVCVCDSGGKSLHGYFDVAKRPHADKERFMRLACRLGADDALWTHSQFARIPGGTRPAVPADGDTPAQPAKQQTLLYLDPDAPGSRWRIDDLERWLESLIDKEEPSERPIEFMVNQSVTENLRIPDKIFPVPAGGVSITESSAIMFTTLGEQRKIFIRGTSVHEVVKADGIHFLAPISAERFCSVVESVGKIVAKREARKDTGNDEDFKWRRCTLPVSHAKTILASDPAQRHLPAIRQVVNCPILTPDGTILEQGYHDHEGGTYITSGQKCEAVELSIAIAALKGLLVDFDFPSNSDFSRAFASLISPALKMGGWINDDFPLDLAEADQSQSGKTYRQKLVCRIYGEKPSSITIAKGGVGSVDESISAALVKGRPFITLGNIRGKIDSTILEEALRGSGRVVCRPAYHGSIEVDCRPFLWQLSTNGAELTRDLANRAIVTRIRKRPDGYKWRTYPEGDLESHVIRNQGFYLSCVFAVIQEWHRLGCPNTGESRHDFRVWCRALDGIVQMVDCSPLLDGHREQQQRTANPGLQWLREIILATRPQDYGRELYTTDLVNVAEDHNIEFPGNPNSRDGPTFRAGRILGKIFKEAESDEIEVDGFTFTRTESTDYTAEGGGRISKKYTITKPL